MKKMYITVKAQNELRQNVSNGIHKYISKSCFINSHRKVKDNYFYDIGISFPDIIIDRNSEPILKYISLTSIFNIKAKKVSSGYSIEIPDRNKVHKEFINKKANLVKLAENTLLINIGDKLIKLSKVQNGLNPIKEIIYNLYDVGEIPVKEIYKRKSKEKGQKYIEFLLSLNYISIEKDKIFPGNQLAKFDLLRSSLKNIDAVLIEILKRGHQYLKENLNIYALTPYLELANSYYLKSYFAEKLLNMNANDIEKHYSEMYRRYTKKPIYQINSNLLEMDEVEIIQKEKDGYIGHDDIFTQFQEDFSTPYFQ